MGSLSEQSKIKKLILAANGIIVQSGHPFQYLVCSTIATCEFENNSLQNIDCVSIVWIWRCLEDGILHNVTDSVSYFPQLLTSEQTNCLFEDLDICISQFGSACFERYRIQILLNETAAIYHKSFHPKRCSILICKKAQGQKYEAATQKNIKNCKL